MNVKQVVDYSRVGRRGTPRHYRAFNMEPPMKEVVVSGEEEQSVNNPPTEQDFTDAVQAHLDNMARRRNYDSIQTAVTYRDDPNPQYAAEGQALFEWRSAVWTYATEQLTKVKTGERTVPTSVNDFLQELPNFSWP